MALVITHPDVFMCSLLTRSVLQPGTGDFEWSGGGEFDPDTFSKLRAEALPVRAARIVSKVLSFGFLG